MITSAKHLFRPASRSDAKSLAELVNFAGECLPLYLWERLKAEGETAWDVGRRRAERETGSFSYRNAVIGEADGECAACLIGYAQPAQPEAIDYGSMPAMFVPLQELENLAPATWYVNVLAAYPA
ncbi:MAG: GNAT family N-acetyltransferase, partial [Rhodomicrobium sp.]|nr:GNAT family N-acetyltransferase [Rhodomicrobium sp.]